MNIKKLSQFSGVNAETIRMYRNMKLLKPIQNTENGYYDYRQQDFYTLLFIRKQRNSELSLSTIQEICSDINGEKMVEEFNQEINRLDEQIKLLKQRRLLLDITKQHLGECLGTLHDVNIMESKDNKYDLYDLWENQKDPKYQTWIHHAELCTISLLIKKEILNSPSMPSVIPFKLGIGTYGRLIKENLLPTIDKLVCCKKGTYLSQLIEIEDLNEMDSTLILPLLDKAKQLQATFVSDTTAFLIRIDNSLENPHFFFRLRARIEINSN